MAQPRLFVCGCVAGCSDHVRSLPHSNSFCLRTNGYAWSLKIATFYRCRKLNSKTSKSVILWTSRQWRSQIFESVYRRPFTSAVRASLTGSSGALSPQKNEFGIGGGDAICRCLEGLTCTLLISIFCHVLSSPPITLTICANLDELQDPYFQKVGRYVVRTPKPPRLRQWVHRPTVEAERSWRRILVEVE